MAGTYATDLIHLWTTQNATGVTGGGSNIVEMTGYTAGGGNTRTNGDTDLYISGGSCLTTNGTTGAGAVSLVINYVADGRTQVTAVAGNVFAFWSLIPTPTAVETVSNTFAGEQFCIGSASGTYRSYTVGGSDVDLYGGWKHRTLDPRNSTTGDSRGTYTANNPNHVGFLYTQNITLRRPPVLGMDNLRYGRHTLTCTGGTLASIDNVNPLSSSAANFSQAADYNDYDGGGTPANGAAESGGYHKFGQFQGENVPGDKGFALKGIISLGSTSTAVNFNSANDNIIITDEFLTYDDFTRIEFRNANSNITWTNVTVSFAARDTRIVAGDAPATTRGNVESFDNPTTLFLDGCTFVDMGTFIFQSNAELLDCVWRRTDLVTQGGATITGGVFQNTISTTASLLSTAATLSSVTDCTFIRTSGTTANAVDLGNIGTNTTVTWDGNKLTGYGSQTAGNNISSTANGAIAVNFTSNVTLTISVVNGATIPTVEISGTGTVNITASVTVNVNGLKDNTEVRIYTAGTTTELAGVESVSGGAGTGINNGTVSGSTDDNTFSFSTSSGANLDIRIFNLDFDSTQFLNFTVSAAGDNIEAVQVEDRVFSNP